jgi:hypothetical protein
MTKRGQIIAMGVLVLYVTFHVLHWFGPAKSESNGFEFSVAKHRDDAQQAQWTVKMSVGTFDLNLNWNP